MAVQTPYYLLQNSMSRPLLGKLVVRLLAVSVLSYPVSFLFWQPKNARTITISYIRDFITDSFC
jgi:hypothetical protein